MLLLIIPIVRSEHRAKQEEKRKSTRELDKNKIDKIDREVL